MKNDIATWIFFCVRVCKCTQVVKRSNYAQTHTVTGSRLWFSQCIWRTENEVILHRPIFISIRILIEMAFLRWKLRIGNDENGTLPWIPLDSFDCWMEFTCHGAPQMATLDFMVKLWSRISFTICNILIIIIECSRSHACVYGQWVILKKVMLFTVLIRDRCKCVQWTRNACETANARPKIKIATL